MNKPRTGRSRKVANTTPTVVGKFQRTTARYDRLHSETIADSGTATSIDRNRILSSQELRRLADVTQVTSASEGVHFTNRLTHTIEVARMARELATNLKVSANDELIEAVGDIDIDAVETAALAHDLGHPPFGHIGETELDRLLTRLGVPDTDMKVTHRPFAS